MTAAMPRKLRVAVVGGGPGGLFFARLLARRAPWHEIAVFEQNHAGATYGFGVTLAGSAQDRLRTADPEAVDRLAAAMVFSDEQMINLDGERILLRYGAKSGAIARLELLQILEDLCREHGIAVAHERRITSPSDLLDFDLVVGADGANSVVRGLMAEQLGLRTRTLGNRFAWYGVAKALKPNGLSFKHQDGGRFIGHYYAYTDAMSTFVAECDEATWESTLAHLPDAERRKRIERIFEEELEGARLVENKSVWRQFQALTTTRWHAGNAVLLGDALRVAHFSIGSGTRLAMDDALALCQALEACEDNVAAALERYVATRKPTRDLFTEATVRSFDWYEDIASAMRLGVVAFTRDFLTRTGRVDDNRLRDYVPDFYREHIAPLQGSLNREERP